MPKKYINKTETIQKQRLTNHGMDQVWGSFRIKYRALYTLFASHCLTCSWFQWLLPLWRSGYYRGSNKSDCVDYPPWPKVAVIERFQLNEGLSSCLTVFSTKKIYKHTLMKKDFIQKIFLFACMLICIKCSSFKLH